MTPEAGSGRRILVYGMQSSGASLFALLLGQIPESVVVVDLWAPHVAPPIRLDVDVVVKATIVALDFDEHLRSFEPSTTILFLRHPADIVASLHTKSYRDYAGTIEKKLRKYDETFQARSGFDLVVHYEDLVADPLATVSRLQDAGLPVPAGDPLFGRTAGEIVAWARATSTWCDRYYGQRWGLGRAHTDRLDHLEPAPSDGAADDQARALAAAHCPSVLAHYEGRAADAAADDPGRVAR